MLLILLRGATSMSGDQQLAFTIMGSLVVGFIIGSITHAKYTTFIKSFLVSFGILSALVALIAFLSIGLAIGIFYGAFFGVFLSLIIGYYGNKR
ncbi:MAG: hypothetical protein WCG20_01155 [bacterium]